MKKINNKGFVLVETLIVSAFVVSIFSIMYANFYPMMGEYEKRENYDDINSIYNAYLIKRMLENYKDDNKYVLKDDNKYVLKDIINDVVEKNLYYTLVSSESDENGQTIQDDYYDTLCKNMNIAAIYLTKYDIEDFKTSVKDVDVQTKEYIDYLPNYKSNPNNLGCRIIVKFKADANKESENKSGEFKYATIGVDCE